MTKGRKGNAEPELVQAAIALHEALDRIERITERADKSALTTRHQIARAGEVLRNAADSHQEFARCLIALTQAVDRVRTRQNASAESLAATAQRVQDRQEELAAFQARFTALADAARDIGSQLGAGDPATKPPEQARASLSAARERFTATAADARALAADARATGLVDLEKEAHAIGQQLEALASKLERLPGGH